MCKTLLPVLSLLLLSITLYAQIPVAALDCSAAQLIQCGMPLQDQSNEFYNNNTEAFQVDGYYQEGNTGPERVYYFDLFYQQAVTVRLDNFSASDDFELILLEDCNEYSGIAYEVNPPGQAEELTVGLTPGRYYILVEGYDGTVGTFDLAVDWDCPDDMESGPIPIQCGEVIAGSTVGYTNDYEFEDYFSCFSNYPNYYEQKDALYRLEVHDARSVQIDLKILTEELQLDIILFETSLVPGPDGQPQPGNCLAIGESISLTERSLFQNLEPGTYWIGVDGGIFGDWFGPLPPGEGFFELSLNCFYSPSPCDLSGAYISNGSTIINIYGGFDINPIYFTGIDCLSDFPPEVPIYGHVYTYYSEEAGAASVLLETENSDLNVFLFDCSVGNRNKSCVGSTTMNNKRLNFMARADTYYQILVASPFNIEFDYHLSVPLPEGPCGNDMPELLPSGSFIQGSLEGAGNDFDFNTNDFFKSCASENRPYDGADRVFQLDVQMITGHYIDHNRIGIDGELITLTAESAMGLFLFNYQCGQSSCLGKIEIPEGGGSDTLYLSDYIYKAGTYYLVLDKAYESGSQDFILERDQVFYIVSCDPETAEIHDINFSDYILNRQSVIQPGDMLLIDYKDKKYIGEAIYENSYFTFITDDNAENISPIKLLSQDSVVINPAEGIFSTTKCGFEPGEAFEFKVVKPNGLILVLDPVFDESGIFADPPTAFQPGATTFVKEIRLKNQQQPVKVDFEEGNVNINALPAAGISFTAHIDVNTSWEIFGLASNDWLRIYDAQAGIQGSPLTTGQGQQKVLVTVQKNPGGEAREAIFEIVAANGFARRVILQQLPSPCSSEAIEISDSVTDVACYGEATGAIQLSGDGSQNLAFNWQDGATGPERQGLQAGIYRVSVSVPRGCEKVLDLSVTEPLDPIQLELEILDPTVCQGEESLAFVSVMGGSSGYHVQWSNGTAGAVSSLVPGSYSVTATDDNNCTATENFKIETFPQQAVAIAGTKTVCLGDSTTLLLTGFQSYRWNTGATTSSIVVKEAGTYSVVAKDDNGCEVEVATQVTVSDKPQPIIAGSTGICPGGFTELSLNGYSTYQWSTGESTSSVIRTSPGVVSVTVTNASGCSGTASVAIVESEALQPQIVGNSELCRGDQTLLDAGSFATYRWSTGSTTRTIPVITAGDYRVTVTDQGGCEGEDAFTVTVYDKPEPSITGDTMLCHGEVSTLSVNQDFSQYSWNDHSAQSYIAVSASGVYRVQVTDERGCTGTDEVSVFVNPEIVLQPELTDIDCLGGSNGSIKANAVGGTGSLTYHWDPNLDNQAELKELGPGAYLLTVTDENECSATSNFEITEPSLLELTVDSIRHVSGDTLGAISISAIGGVPPYTYFWSWPGGFRLTNVPMSGPLPAGSYDIRVEDANGCKVILDAIKIDQMVPANDLFAESSSLNIYPNPGAGRFILEWQDRLLNEVHLRVIDGLGKTAVQVTIPAFSRVTSINLSDEPAGMYFLIISGKNNQATRKLIIE